MHVSEKSLRLVLTGLKVAIVLGVLVVVIPLVLYGLNYAGFTSISYEDSRIDAIGKFEEAKAKGKLKKGFVYIGPDESTNTPDGPNPHFIWYPKPPAGFHYIVSVNRHRLEVRLLIKNEGDPGFELVPTW